MEDGEKKQEEGQIEGTNVQPEIPQPEQPEAPQPEQPVAPPEPAVETSVQPPEVRLNVDPQTALNLTAQEYDKRITEAEAIVAELKKQKAAYIYDTNVKVLLASAQQQPAPEGT